MTRPIQTRLLIFVAGCVVIISSIGSSGQSKAASKPRKEELLATLAYTDSGATRLFSLWEIPLTVTGDQYRKNSTTTGQPQRVETPPNTAFILLDSALTTPFSGNLVWVLKISELSLPQDLVITSGSIAWNSGKQRAYVTLSRSGATWERLQVFEAGTAQSFGTYSPMSSPRDDRVLDSALANAKPFAEWKTDALPSAEVFQVTAVQTVVEPQSLLIQLLDAGAFKRTSGLKGTMYLRLNLKDGTFSKVASE